MRRRSSSFWAAGLLWLCATPACATNAVALLADVRNPTTTEAMLRNLATLAQTCDWARRYDVIVFHEGRSDALLPRLEALGNRTRLRLRARDISDVFATHAPATTDWPRRRLRTFGIGYRRMCRFWFSGVLELADVRNLSYLLRLDTDSELRCRPGSRDPFELMAHQKAVYGYVAVKTDHPMVAKNMTAFGAAYARRVPPVRDAFYKFPPDARRVPVGCPAPMFYTVWKLLQRPSSTERHRAGAGMETTSHRWRGIYTPSSRCSYGDDVASMGVGRPKFDFHTGSTRTLKS